MATVFSGFERKTRAMRAIRATKVRVGGIRATRVRVRVGVRLATVLCLGYVGIWGIDGMSGLLCCLG